MGIFLQYFSKYRHLRKGMAPNHIKLIFKNSLPIFKLKKSHDGGGGKHEQD